MSNIRLIGSNIRKISAFRNPNFSGKVSLQTNVKILQIEKVEESKNTLRVSYSFEVDYKGLGNIFVEGNIFVSSDAKTIKQILKNWESKNFKTEENIIITNMILQKASVKCFSIEDELGLPTHIRLPTVNLKK